MKRILPYVYICTHKTNNQFYIGFRCANKLPADDDILVYKTSSKYVKPIFDQFDVQILAEFFDKTDAYDYEQQLINEYWKHPLLLNKSCFYNNKRFSLAGIPKTEKTKLKISLSSKGKVMPVDRKQRKLLTPIHKQRIRESSIGHIMTEDNKHKLLGANKGKRWYTNGDINIKSFNPIDSFWLGRTIKGK